MPRFLCWLDTEDPATDAGWAFEGEIASMHDAAEAFAEDAHYDMDAWEIGRQFDVLCRGDWDNAPMARFTIEVEARPTFRVRKMRDEVQS